jgi:hypothetical protein
MISIGRWARFPLPFPFMLAILCCSVSGPPAGSLPDLTVAVSTVPGSPVKLADSWTVTVKVTNGGASQSAACVLRYQITNAATGQATNVDVAVPALDAGASFTDPYAGTYSGRIGSNPGTNSFVVAADAGATVSESNETNNTASFSLPVFYPELVIDTYYPLDSGKGLTIGTNALYLFGSTAENSAPLASDTTGTNPDGDQVSYGYIDYTPAAGLAPGGVYYIRIQARNGTAAGAYAILVATAPVTLPRDASWFFPEIPGVNTLDSPYENDGVLSSGVPSNPAIIAVGGKLNRYVAASGDIDWVMVTLP